MALRMFSEDQQLAAARRFFGQLGELLDTRISVRLWDGSVIPLGENVDSDFFLSIASAGVLGSLLRKPTAENLLAHYASGTIDFHGGNIREFLVVARSRHAKKKLRSLNKSSLLRSALPLLTARESAREVEHTFAGDEKRRGAGDRDEKSFIQFHYDVSNRFYQLFLDPQMQYTCGYFRSWENSLEQAQTDKLEMICRKLQLKPGERMLDIGCGWGGLVCYAAKHYGVEAHGVTLSQNQFDLATTRVREMGLEDKVKIELRDYATLDPETDGFFDKISSIGMYEHVGIAKLPAYFKKISQLLPDRGMVLNHGITRKAKSSKRGEKRKRGGKSLLLKHIFPGSELDDIGNSVRVMESAGFEIHDVEGWREHYALTCKNWCENLSANEEEAIRQVGLERYRMWVLYLASVSLGFEDGPMRLYQVVASKHKAKGSAERPPTREHLYQD
ncbi:MAG: class I SAM-dependent methyltransferase [Deltaproteobacteria bacterium]|nr:class I SAM-dependent methyltransferase [Deltaproteobacteria bacterium]